MRGVPAIMLSGVTEMSHRARENGTGGGRRHIGVAGESL